MSNMNMGMDSGNDMNMDSDMDTGMGNMDMPMDGEMEMMEMEMHHRSSFYSSTTVTILFSEYKTNSTLSYALSLIAIIGFGILTVYLKAVKEGLIRWQKNKNKNVAALDADTGEKSTHTVCTTAAFLDPLKKCITSFSSPMPAFYITCLTFVISVFDFCLMLIAMTFEIGVFLCTCLGLSLGYLLFLYPLRLSETRSSPSKPLDTNCCDATL